MLWRVHPVHRVHPTHPARHARTEIDPRLLE